ncbi:terpene synthase family protein [Streptomyces sp. NPDC057438]|uniref:terpene synthase family protein n=1 Tax=Streptomyces sp. NPDC057438 TaxID=3346133 RepID=UPI0036CDFB94
MVDRAGEAVPAGHEAVLRWARDTGLVTGEHEERRLARMRLTILASGALPGGDLADVVLTAQWAAFICCLDDHIDRRDLGMAARDLEQLTAPLRRVLASDADLREVTGRHARVLADLFARTAAGMSAAWRRRLVQDYTDFLDATEQEVTIRQSATQLTTDAYVRLRRRTITVLPMLTVLERTGHAPLPEDLPPELEADLAALRRAGADIAGWVNDLASACDDATVGQDNLVTLIARGDGCDTSTARRRVSARITQRQKDFRITAGELRETCTLPPDEAAELGAYVTQVERYVTASLTWMARTNRYAADATRVRDRMQSGGSARDDQRRCHVVGCVTA